MSHESQPVDDTKGKMRVFPWLGLVLLLVCFYFKEWGGTADIRDKADVAFMAVVTVNFLVMGLQAKREGKRWVFNIVVAAFAASAFAFTLIRSLDAGR